MVKFCKIDIPSLKMSFQQTWQAERVSGLFAVRPAVCPSSAYLRPPPSFSASLPPWIHPLWSLYINLKYIKTLNISSKLFRRVKKRGQNPRRPLGVEEGPRETGTTGLGTKIGGRIRLERNEHVKNFIQEQ